MLRDLVVWILGDSQLTNFHMLLLIFVRKQMDRMCWSSLIWEQQYHKSKIKLVFTILNFSRQDELFGSQNYSLPAGKNG